MDVDAFPAEIVPNPPNLLDSGDHTGEHSADSKFVFEYMHCTYFESTSLKKMPHASVTILCGVRETNRPK